MNAAGAQVARGLTGADGRYRIGGVRPGSYTALVTASGHRPAAALVALHGPAATSDITLTGAGTLAGTISHAGGPGYAAGVPLAGANVIVTDAAGQVIAQAVTGPDGTYRFTGLPEGGYTIVASGFHPVATPLTLTAGHDLDLDLTLGQGSTVQLITTAGEGGPVGHNTTVGKAGHLQREFVPGHDSTVGHPMAESRPPADGSGDLTAGVR
jgi:hypothetical protein